jgi:hypothetical protein
MTSMAFFFGVLPLAIATGAGAGAMNAIGTAVTGGMLSATFIDLFYIPLLFVLASRMFKGNQKDQTPGPQTGSPNSPEGGPGTPPSPGIPLETGPKPNPTTSSEGRLL